MLESIFDRGLDLIVELPVEDVYTDDGQPTYQAPINTTCLIMEMNEELRNQFGDIASETVIMFKISSGSVVVNGTRLTINSTIYNTVKVITYRNMNQEIEGYGCAI